MIGDGFVTRDEVSGAVQDWLLSDEARELLLLLDECDEFLRQESSARFSNVIRLRDLWSATGHRFKVVFAGLQHVSRFQNQPNQPVSQLVDPITVGPLDARAASQLLTRPMAALGFNLSQPQIDQIVAWSRCNASLLQHTARELVVRLYKTSPGKLWPWPVPQDIVDGLLGDTDLQQAWSTRLLTLTLELDHRYKLIAYLLANAAHNDQRGPVDIHVLWRQAREAWPSGFKDTSIDEFRAFCNEMVGMRILAEPEQGKVQLFSPQVTRSFGSDADAVRDLIDDAEAVLDPPTRMTALAARWLPDGDDLSRVGPASVEQLTELVGAAGAGESRAHTAVVFRSPALGLDRVAPVLTVYATQGVWSDVEVEDTSLVTSKGDWARAMRPPDEERALRLVVSERFRDPTASLESWRESLEAAKSVGSRGAGRGIRSGVLVAFPTMARVAVLWELELYDRVATLSRLTSDSVKASIRAEKMRDVACRPDELGVLLKVTGGWPILLDRVQADVASGGSLTDAVEALAAHLDSVAGASELLAASGLDAVDEEAPADQFVADVFAQCVYYEDLADVRSEMVAVIAEDLEVPEERVQQAWDVLELLSAVVPVAGGPAYGPDPVLAAAWRRTHN